MPLSMTLWTLFSFNTSVAMSGDYPCNLPLDGSLVILFATDVWMICLSLNYTTEQLHIQ